MMSGTEQYSPPLGIRGRIFVVEDEEDIALLVRHNLEAAGYEKLRARQRDRAAAYH